MCIEQSYLQDVLGAAVQAEEGPRQQESLLFAETRHRNRQNHRHHPLRPGLHHLLQSRQSRRQSRLRRCRVGLCFLFVVQRSRQSRLRFPLLVVRW